jgi:hypothetical protein
MKTKTQLNLFIAVSTAEELRARAQSVGLGPSDLGDLLLRFGLERVGVEALREHARTLTTTRNTAGLRMNERAVLNGLVALERDPVASNAGKVREFLTDEIAGRAGIPIREADRALNALKCRGHVSRLDMAPGEVDRWGRATRVVWGRVGEVQT